MMDGCFLQRYGLPSLGFQVIISRWVAVNDALKYSKVWLTLGVSLLDKSKEGEDG